MLLPRGLRNDGGQLEYANGGQGQIRCTSQSIQGDLLNSHHHFLNSPVISLEADLQGAQLLQEVVMLQ